jgi:hypothetical protein
MKGLIATVLCMAFVSVAYGVADKQMGRTDDSPNKKEAVAPATKTEVCEKDRHSNEKCQTKDTPKPVKEEKKTHHDGGKETR